MPDHLIPVIDHFPEHQRKIFERQKSDPDFCDLCADYNEVIAMLRQTEHSHDPKHSRHYSELMRLRGELEAEILYRLRRD